MNLPQALEISVREDTTAGLLLWRLPGGRDLAKARIREYVWRHSDFIHAGTVSFEAAYLLGFLRSFSLRISVFGHMDDLAGGPAGRVFPELDFFSASFSK